MVSDVNLQLYIMTHWLACFWRMLLGTPDLDDMGEVNWATYYGLVDIQDNQLGTYVVRGGGGACCDCVCVVYPGVCYRGRRCSRLNNTSG